MVARRLFFPARLGLFQKHNAKVPVCLPQMRFFNRPWAYIIFACEKFLPFAKYVGLQQNKARVSSNEPPLALKLYSQI